MSEVCQQIVGEMIGDDDSIAYDSKGRSKAIALCKIHRDPYNPDWNMRWPCPHAALSWTRNRDGRTVHLSGCRHERIAWPWATGKALKELVQLQPKYGWKFCKHCIPNVDSALLVVDIETSCPQCKTKLDEHGYCTDPGCVNVGKTVSNSSSPLLLRKTTEQ